VAGVRGVPLRPCCAMHHSFMDSKMSSGWFIATLGPCTAAAAAAAAPLMQPAAQAGMHAGVLVGVLARL